MRYNPLKQKTRLLWVKSTSLLLVTLLTSNLVMAQTQVRVVNLIPNFMSNEALRDSEPNVAVNPTNPLQIVASAFTSDPMNSGLGPIFVSTDGGNTWDLRAVVPGGQTTPGNSRTVDITLRFGGTSNVLYAGILRLDNSNLNVLRQSNFLAATVMEQLVNRANEDQPYVQSTSVMGGSGVGNDRVYIGHNDFNAPSGRTATSETSLNAATGAAPAGFSALRLNPRVTCGQDGPAIRTSIHASGRIYGVYYRWTTCPAGGATGTGATADVVVVRDDTWASGATPFTSLVDTGDSNAGVRVVTGISLPPFGSTLGTQRVGGSHLSIAVDPNNRQRIYIAWAQGTTAAGQSLRVRRSMDGGATWSSDLRSINSATNPALAINIQGTVGLLYQQLVNPGTGNRWQTHLERSSDDFATAPTDLTLANVADNNGTYTGTNPIGDYLHLQAMGKDFYGVFSANNTPISANFPNNVTYQRNANFTTNTLFADAAMTIPVVASIDPFFFRVSDMAAADDFYVRDWTDSPTSGDTGLEPSTKPLFFTTSDVWNRRGTLPGSFPNDQPENEDAGNGAGNVGDNWAFARIRRNALPTSGSKTVTAHFLVSKLGTGSSYVDAGSADPDVSFPNPDPTVIFSATDLGPTITVAYPWHLNSVTSTHLCLAVEISSPGDLFAPPSLVGSTPGWPSPDLRVINDNNKAQRNMGLSTTPARGAGFSDSPYAIAHNAALFTRDMTLRYEVSPDIFKKLRGATINVIGGQSIPLALSGNITLGRMQPGENRWIGLNLSAPSGSEGEILGVNFYEMVSNAEVNGFTLGVRPSSMTQVIRDSLELHRSVFTRLGAGFGVSGATEQAAAANQLLKQNNPSQEDYLAFLQSQSKSVNSLVRELVESQYVGDGFGLQKAANILDKEARGKRNFFCRLFHSNRGSRSRFQHSTVAHTTLLNRMDSLLTMQQLAKGDTADILQNVRWQAQLYGELPALARLQCAAELLSTSERFIDDYGRRRIGNRDYPKLIQDGLECLHQTAMAPEFGNLKLEENIVEIERNMGDLAGLQKAHRGYLMKLQSLVQ